MSAASFPQNPRQLTYRTVPYRIVVTQTLHWIQSSQSSDSSRMAGTRYYFRRIKFLTSSPPFKLLATFLCLFTAFRWVLRHNHDEDLKTITIDVDGEGVDWSRLYYAQFVRDGEGLCNALVVWSLLEEIGTRAQRIMLYPSNWSPNETQPQANNDRTKALTLTPTARLLQTAEQSYYVHLSPLNVLQPGKLWDHAFHTKLLAFNLTEYSRVLVLEPDSLVLKNLDELFLFPDAPIGMPLITQEEGTGWGMGMMLIKPDTKTFKKLLRMFGRGYTPPDLIPVPLHKLLYSVFGDKILRIPQRPYNLLTSEFRRKDHTHYMTKRNRSETWDPDDILREAKVLQYADKGLPRPWVEAERGVLNRYMPGCREKEGFGGVECRERGIWLRLYREFRERRVAVCGVGFEGGNLGDEGVDGFMGEVRVGNWTDDGLFGD